MFHGPDPPPGSVVHPVRGKVALYNPLLHAIAQKYRTRVVDLWAMDVLRDPRAFSEDRLHFSPEAHRRIALRVAEELGLPVEEDWREPWPKPARRRDWLRARRDDLVWARTHFWPWLVRQIRGVSTGDGLQPKRPKLMPLKPPAQLTGDSEMVNAAG
uniref:SGNH hydrolase-type esterase domain-containing protein n=1 Tax=Thermocrispum agreste TaxID=37925 RepID=A0A2W4L1R1_9PSEU|nr:MAG: hypothetical protein DIU77_19055 [Thermocrispum agreste]